MPVGVTLPSALDLRFSAAEKFFAGKVTLTKDEYVKLRGQAQLYAFTVARISSLQLVADFQAEVQRAIVEGTTLADFKKAAGALLAKHGWTGITPWHIETVFRTNVQMAYGVGQYEALRAVADALPFWKYVAINDHRVRAEHWKLNGYIYPADHPFWKSHYPPWDFNCRCDVQPMTAEEVGNQKVHTDDGPPSTFTGPGTMADVLAKAGLKPVELAKQMLPKLTPAQEDALFSKLQGNELLSLSDEGAIYVRPSEPLRIPLRTSPPVPVGPTAAEIDEAIAENKVFDKKARRAEQIKRARKNYAEKQKAARRAAKEAPPAAAEQNDPFQRLSAMDFKTSGTHGVPVRRDGTVIEGHNVNVRIVELGGKEHYEFYGKAANDDLANLSRTGKEWHGGGARNMFPSEQRDHIFREGTGRLTPYHGVGVQEQIGEDRVRFFDTPQGIVDLRVNVDRWYEEIYFRQDKAATVSRTFRVRIPRTGDDAIDYANLQRAVKGTPLEEMLKQTAEEESRRVGIIRAITHELPAIMDRDGGTFILNGKRATVRSAHLASMSEEQLLAFARENSVRANFDTIGWREMPKVGYGTHTVRRGFNYDDVRVFHGTRGDAKYVANMLEKGSVQSSYHRARAGYGGLTHADDHTGGSDSLFTRIFNRQAVTGSKRIAFSDHGFAGNYQFVWGGKELERLDVYAFSGDTYGKAYGVSIGNRRTIDQMATAVRHATDNELMFRYGIDFTNLDYIATQTEAQRQSLLTELRSRGIAKIGGRAIEDVVKVRYYLEETWKP